MIDLAMATVGQVQQHAAVRAALEEFHTHRDMIVQLAIAVQQIPAPTFDERKRAEFIQERFERIGLHDVTRDALHNVYGRLPGLRPNLAPVIVSAHMDTVFPQETDLAVRRADGLVYGPGIADNSAGVAGLLALAATLLRHALMSPRDIWLVANVGEEGVGDLRGMRAVVDRFGAPRVGAPRVGAPAYIVVEGGMYGYVLHEAIGVKRYRVQVATPGGHSWSDFGRLSAVHVLGHLISRIDAIKVPETPKTTFNVGVIEGGTSINTIASLAALQLDLRSEEPASLNALVEQFSAILARLMRHYPDAKIEVQAIGDRPAGGIARSAPLVQAADAALRAVGCTNVRFLRGSTDANIPLSRGLPAVCIGLARSANAHRTDEYLDTADLASGLQQLLLVTLAAAGFNMI